MDKGLLPQSLTKFSLGVLLLGILLFLPAGSNDMEPVTNGVPGISCNDGFRPVSFYLEVIKK